FDVEAFDAASALQDLTENRIIGLRKYVGYIDKTKAETKIGAVGACRIHRFGVGHARERAGKRQAADLEHADGEFFDHFIEKFFVDERSFNVQLGEFRLPVRAQVFVAEAARQLKVTLHAADHEQLFEQLRRLG